MLESKMTEALFNFEEAEDDESLRKLEDAKNEKSTALHTTGIIMALCAGALYGIQSIIGFFLNLCFEKLVTFWYDFQVKCSPTRNLRT